MEALLRTPTNIGGIFFSGSQSVIKGDEVQWILEDTWAFQTTEACAVSTNASPFVQLKQGQIFIIYKRTAQDIKEGNRKGVYIFDRDTIVSLAYPQEVTQDIIIENDIYNNNLNEITIEADKNPIAKISVTNQFPSIGETITVSGASSYAVPPATIASYKWTVNGVVQSTTGVSFTITPTEAKQLDIILMLTDSDGKKGSTSMTVAVKENPTYPDVIVNYLSGLGGKISADNNRYFQAIDEMSIAVSSVTGTLEVKQDMAISATNQNGNYELSLWKNGTQVHTQRWDIGNKNVTVNNLMIYTVPNTTVLATDKWVSKLRLIEGSGSYFSYGTYISQEPAFQLKISNRIK